MAAIMALFTFLTLAGLSEILRPLCIGPFSNKAQFKSVMMSLITSILKFLMSIKSLTKVIYIGSHHFPGHQYKSMTDNQEYIVYIYLNFSSLSC